MAILLASDIVMGAGGFMLGTASGLLAEGLLAKAPNAPIAWFHAKQVTRTFLAGVGLSVVFQAMKSTHVPRTVLVAGGLGLFCVAHLSKGTAMVDGKSVFARP